MWVLVISSVKQTDATCVAPTITSTLFSHKFLTEVICTRGFSLILMFCSLSNSLGWLVTSLKFLCNIFRFFFFSFSKKFSKIPSLIYRRYLNVPRETNREDLEGYDSITSDMRELAYQAARRRMQEQQPQNT